MIRIAFLIGAIIGAVAGPASAETTAAKRSDVERKGAAVMPFSQSDTTHIFAPTATGGTQTVIVKDADPRQISLVRSHLRKEASAFARGDYADPMAIHGVSMPGLPELRAGARRLNVVYANVSRGGQIVYRSADPKIIDALHRWFDAQVDEHGPHAMKM